MHKQVAATPLVVAIAKAEATDKMLHVVDESLRRAAEAREEREKLEAEARDKAERDDRLEQAKRAEQEAAQRLTERNERVAEDIARREATRADAQRAISHGDLFPLNVVI